MVAIFVYNTLSRKKEELEYQGDRVGIYVCGVTPYTYTHLGHARPSVVWDVIKKFLRSQGHSVFHVQNFTDVDDKIIARAQEEGVPALELSAKYSQEYLESMDALGVERADLYPRVSEHMEDIIDMIRDLEAKGHAYRVGGNVFYDVQSFPEYGRLSNQQLDELQAGTRFEVDVNKQNPMDFALWKEAKPGEPAWDSPWGQGRPGWHIECSAMAFKYLGAGFCFHGGGSDLVFPHHENEIAQTEGAIGQPLARYWIHNGMLNLRAEKMSKSLGNFVTIKDVVKEHPKELFRFYMLSNHYRSELEYHDHKLQEVRRGWQRLNECVHNIACFVGEQPPPCAELSASGRQVLKAAKEARSSFVAAMSDDFNTALAIASLFDLARLANAFLGASADNQDARYVLGEVLAVFHELGGGILGIIRNTNEGEGLTEPLMELVLDLRKELRAAKNYALADMIRDRLGALGIVVEDTSRGSRWKVQRVDG